MKRMLDMAQPAMISVVCMQVNVAHGGASTALSLLLTFSVPLAAVSSVFPPLRQGKLVHLFVQGLPSEDEQQHLEAYQPAAA